MRTLVLIVAMLAMCWPASGFAQENLPVVQVGVIFDGTGNGQDVLLIGEQARALAALREQTHALTRRQFDVRFDEKHLVTGDWTLESIRRGIDKLLADPEVDVVVSLGALATNDLVRRGPMPKPVICAWAIDPQAQNLPLVRDTSGVENMTYILTPNSILRDLGKFQEVLRLSRVHILVDELFIEGIPELEQYTAAAAATLGIELVTIPIKGSASDVLRRLPADIETAYLTPAIRMPAAEFDKLIQGFNQRKIPTFSLLGEAEVRRGVLAGVGRQADQLRVARRLALNIQRVLLGDNPSKLPVTLEEPDGLMLNLATAREIGVYPRWRVLIEAELINDDRTERGRDVSMADAVQAAVTANLNLTAFDRSVAAGQETIEQARSAFRPQAQASVSGVQIDQDRAAASFGQQPERTGTATVGVSQLIYGDGARANLKIAREGQRSLVEQREALMLDIALDTSVAFLNVLRAETLERIQRDNLKLTESNLELARRRERIGSAGPADVYRWESRLASDRSSVITASNQTRAARNVLNQLMNRPQEEPFHAVVPDLDDKGMFPDYNRIETYVDNPQAFGLFREFSVGEGLDRSPDLRALDAAIAAQDRVLLAARRSFWAPEVSLSGEVSERFEQSGAGLPMSGTGVPIADRNNWSIGLSAALPLYVGGARDAETRQARETVAQLRFERDLVRQQVELGIRTALYDAVSTYQAIELTREAADAADKNLELIADSYTRGVVPVINLLDAQNAQLVAAQSAENSVFDFIIDMMEVQRATNNFDFFESDEERKAWFQRLDGFIEERGGTVPGATP
ncbi:hypothetical protein ABI59_12585 [Acidobacteria bacterium Mor1]|nr:hypothetical protein ABI59_12585 [Acidobacteria bacterium Mor1]